jgi:hypothetical protein
MDNYQETTKQPTGQDDDIIPEDQRNEQLTSIAREMQRQGCDREAFFAALIDTNQRRCKPPLGYEELMKIAVSFAQCQPQPQKEGVLPVIVFVQGRCQIGVGWKTRCREVYNAYKRWCNDAGRLQMGRNRFYKEFGRAFPDCTRCKTRQDNSGTSPVWMYENIALLVEYKMAGF